MAKARYDESSSGGNLPPDGTQAPPPSPTHEGDEAHFTQITQEKSQVPHPAAPIPVTAEDILLQGDACAGLGKYDEALKFYQQAVELDVSCIRGYYAIGGILNALGRYQEAINTLDFLIKLDVHDTFSYKALSKKGASLVELGKIDEALAVQDASLAIKPTVAAYCRKGVILYKLNKDKEALDCFTQAHALEMQAKYSAPSPFYSSVRAPNSVDSVKVVQQAEEIEQRLRLKEQALQERDSLRQAALSLQATAADTHHIVSTIPGDAVVPEIVQQAANQFKSLLRKSTTLTGAAITQLNQPKVLSTANDNKVSELEQQIAQMQAQMQALVTTLQNSDAYAMMQIKQEIAALAPDVMEYQMKVYHGIMSLIAAYRSINTGLVKGEVDADNSTAETVVVAGAKKVASVATEFMKGVPFVGSVIGALDKIIDIVYAAYKQHQLTNKVTAVNSFVESKFVTEDDISRNIAKLALTMAKMKAADITASEGSTQDVNGWITKVIMSATGADCPESYAARLALKDVALFMAYLYAEYVQITSSSEPFSDQIHMIVCAINNIVIPQTVDDSVDAVQEMVDDSTSPGLPYPKQIAGAVGPGNAMTVVPAAVVAGTKNVVKMEKVGCDYDWFGCC